MVWPNRDALAKHLRAPHIEPWRAVARHCGLLERHFVAYEILGEQFI
jgi:hypothetical protein